MKARYGNCLVFFGGGLCDCANYYISGLANRLNESNLFQDVYVGFYSFRCLTEEGLIRKWSNRLFEVATNSHGGFYGTARETNLVDTILMQKAIQRCKLHNIKWIFVGGGDGTARQISEIADSFSKEGINFVFTMPLTIDGINGGESIGINAAVNASLSLIEEVSATTLRTLEANKFPWIIFELQGRNRDDILLRVLREITSYNDFSNGRIGDFGKGDVQIIALPANFSWSVESLRKTMQKTNDTSYHGILLGVPTIILISEGAKIKMNEIKKLGEEEQIKIRSFKIGHYSQMNGFTTYGELEMINSILDKTVEIIKDWIKFQKPYTIVFEDFERRKAKVEDISYFGVNNPKDYRYSFSTDEYYFLSKYVPQ